MALRHFQRIAPQVVAVQLDQVEGVEEYAVVSAVVTDKIERGNAVVIAGDRFAVDDAGARAQPGERINDQGKAIGQIIARTAIEPHLRAVLARNDAERQSHLLRPCSGACSAERPRSASGVKLGCTHKPPSRAAFGQTGH